MAAAMAKDFPPGSCSSLSWSVLEVIGADESMVSTHATLVHHGAVVGHLDRFPDAGLATLHHAQLVGRVVHAQWDQLIPWQPLPTTAWGNGKWMCDHRRK